MNKSVKNAWLGISLFGILVGLAMIIWPATSLKAICIIAGISAILLAVLQFFLQWRIDPKGFFSTRSLLAVLLLVFGLHILIRAELVLMLWLGGLLLVDGVYKFRLSFAMKKDGMSGWKAAMIFAAVFALLGLLMLFVPATAGNVITVLIGIGLVINCAVNIWLHLRTGKLGSGSSFVV